MSVPAQQQQTSGKYRGFTPVPMETRHWPGKVISQAPEWCSVDLRDGNQALVTPMDAAKKRRMWDLLLAMGFKQIEVGFPSASETEFGFIRTLIDDNLIPEDVTIQVLTPARQPHIRRTFGALTGVKRAVVHLYNSTSTLQREVVFAMDQGQVTDLAVQGATWMVEEAARFPDTEWVFEYSPESFTGTELDFAADICNQVLAVWRPTPEHPSIINLPATVEMATPNVFADQVEWMASHLVPRDGVILSVHPHNDRGTAVAAAELALMAGADRVEGTLFGNGERTGNVDIVTLALNLYTQGIDPQLNLGAKGVPVDDVVSVAEDCTGINVSPRHPYAGSLVFTAFSGSHQDAISKGLKKQTSDAPWGVPYLPIDPTDVGRSYGAVVRVNSQSGKGGAAVLMERSTGVDLPKPWQIALGAEVKKATDDSGSELSGDDIWQLFKNRFVNRCGAIALTDARHRVTETESGVSVEAEVLNNGADATIHGNGTGPLDAFAAGISQMIGASVEIDDYRGQALGHGADAQALALVTVRVGGKGPMLGAGVDQDITRAALMALVSALS